MAAFKWVPEKGKFVSEFEFTPLALSLGKVKAGKYKPKPRTVYELTDPAFHPGA